MAQRRMFSIKIINSARFLRMPYDSQNLYFHLGIRADDDGVVEAYPVMKLLGSTEDNLKVLAAKGFIQVLNDDLVAFITDWKEHNLIRADRKIDSIYKPLLLKLLPEVELVEPRERADATKKQTGRPTDDQRTAQVRLGKDRLSKDNTIAPQSDAGKEEGKIINEVMEGFKEVNPSYSRLYAMKTQRDALGRLIKQHGREKIENVIGYLPKSNANKFAPTITTPYNLEMKLGELLAWAQKQKDTSAKGKNIIM